MIKAKATTPAGRQILMLGLSGENVTRLAAGEPIHSHLESVGFPGMDLVIAYGKTEGDVLIDLNNLARTIQGDAP